MKTKNEAFIPKKNERAGHTSCRRSTSTSGMAMPIPRTTKPFTSACRRLGASRTDSSAPIWIISFLPANSCSKEAASISPKLSGIIGFVLTIFVSIRTSKISKILKHNQLTDQYNKERQAFQRTFEGHRNSITVDGLRSNKLLKRHSTEC